MDVHLFQHIQMLYKLFKMTAGELPTKSEIYFDHNNINVMTIGTYLL